MIATRRATAHRFHAPASAESLECRQLLAAQLIEDINPNPWSPYGPPDVPGQPLSVGPGDDGLRIRSPFGERV